MIQCQTAQIPQEGKRNYVLDITKMKDKREGCPREAIWRDTTDAAKSVRTDHIYAIQGFSK